MKAQIAELGKMPYHIDVGDNPEHNFLNKNKTAFPISKNEGFTCKKTHIGNR